MRVAIYPIVWEKIHLRLVEFRHVASNKFFAVRRIIDDTFYPCHTDVILVSRSSGPHCKR